MTRLCNDYLGTSVPVYGGEGLAEEILRGNHPATLYDVSSGEE